MHRPIPLTILALLLLTASPAFAEPASVDEQAKAALQRAAATIRQAGAMHVTVDTAMNVEMQGRKQENAASYETAMARPNRFALRATEGEVGNTIVSDGQTLYIYVPMINQYTAQPVPEDVNELNNPQAAPGLSGSGVMPLFTTMLSGDPYDAVLRGVDTVEYVGREELDGREAHRLRFAGPGRHFDVWLAADEQSLPLRIEPDMRKIMEDSLRNVPADRRPPQWDEMNVHVRVTLRDWQVGEALPEPTFQFSPPDGAEQVESFAAAQQQRRQQPEQGLVGEPAPAFETTTLDDKPFKLNDHIGDGVVVLDFWATWCGPCVRAMPEMERIVEEYADRGVTLYAVNVGESADQVRAFLKREELNVNVVMDKSSQIAGLYQVTGIPTTVMIAPDGQVRAVNVGFGAERFRRQLEELAPRE